MNRSAFVIVLSFGATILVGSLLLRLPQATTTNMVMPFVDALFMATSATCVTGLVVHDIGREYTLFGQLVILMLIQIGGLGIITFSTFVVSIISQKLSIGSRRIIQESFFQQPIRNMRALFKQVFIWVFAIEGIGALCLYIAMGAERKMYDALFHAISAFCNAGFSLYSDSLTRFRGNASYNLIMVALVITGGLGFIVLSELWMNKQNLRKAKLSVHTRLTLLATGGFLVFGMLVFGLFEAGNVLADMDGVEKATTIVFQSVTPRTAGFNTVDYAELTHGTLAVMLFLMVVGGSPGSAAGGIKTTTMAVCFLFLLSRISGKRHPAIFNRSIPADNLHRAFGLLAAYLVMLGLVTVSLLIVQYGTLSYAKSQGHFLEVLFESTSALSTVGLSLGLTEKLSVAGKMIIIGAMFVGRIGVLTVAMILMGKDRGADYKFAEESVLIG